jgi:hypothetical protein
MKIKTLVLSLIFLSVWGCNSKEPQTQQEEEESQLTGLYNELEVLAQSETCGNAADWSFTPLGSKPCGGPWRYLSYSLNMDTASFLNLVEQLRVNELAHNERWGLISDCSSPQEPADIECQNGLPIFTY